MDKNLIWKDIPSYEGLYKISENGLVYSFYTNKTLNFKKTNAYLEVGLTKNKKYRICKVHKLVAESFLENPYNLKYVNHKDGNKRNNHYSNLEFCTLSYNQKHAYDNGLKRRLKGEKNPNCKLKEFEVRDILNNCIIGDKNCGCSHFAKKYNVSIAQISRIVRGVSYDIPK